MCVCVCVCACACVCVCVCVSSLTGKVGITLDIEWKEPFTLSNDDLYAADRAIMFKLGWFGNPIYGSGDYPEVMKRFVASKSARQGYSTSRLPTFTDEEKRMNKGKLEGRCCTPHSYPPSRRRRRG